MATLASNQQASHTSTKAGDDARGDITIMAKHLGALLCFLYATFFSSMAPAKSEYTFARWRVEPPEITSDAIILNKGDFVQRARLLPWGLIELAEDIRVGKDKKDVIRSGEQLFELSGGTIYKPIPSLSGVFCQMRTFDVASRGMLRNLIIKKRYCLVDHERDGTIDDVVLALYCPYDLPMVSVKLPSGPPTITGSTYRRLPVKDFKDAPMVGIAFNGIAPLDGDPRFIQAFGSGNPIPLFGEKHSRAGDGPGQRISFGGAFTVLHIQGQTVTVRNDKPIPAQPFGIIRTGTCDS